MINNDSIVNSKLPAASSSALASTTQPLPTLSSRRPSKPMLAVPPSVVLASYTNQMSLNSGVDKEGELVQKPPVLEANWVAEYTGSEPSADTVSQLTPEKQNEALQSWPGSEIALCLPGINSDLHNEMVRLNQDAPILSAVDNYLDEALHEEGLLDSIYPGNQVHIPVSLKNIAY